LSPICGENVKLKNKLNFKVSCPNLFANTVVDFNQQSGGRALKGKLPPVPAEKSETIRRQIITLLREGDITAKEISMAVGIREKDVFQHLEHIQQTFRHEKEQLAVRPAVCKGCGFVFRKRMRLTKPGKCPVCRGSSIEEPGFSISGC